jgi:lipopolysaccharide/colanic/teichoic acid biosynthesis glycosyltransferase
MEIKSFLGLRKRRFNQPSTMTGAVGSAQAEVQFAPARRRDEASGIPGLHDSEQMRRILARERANCDQADSTLTLLAFAVSEGNSSEDLPLLASLLGWRVPRADAIGLLGRNQLGVVLPDTSISGAHEIARAVMEAVVEQRDRELAYAVFVYPSHEFAARASDDHEDKPEESSQAYPLEAFFTMPAPRWKRLVDVIGAAAGILFLSPLLFVISLAIKLGSRGPIFFLQDREGIGGRRFKILKFRTMYADAELQQADLHELNEQDGPAFKIRNDPRVTPFGRILRRTCLDELPQLWNVLKGDMSLVGPRPLPWNESRACARWQRRRLDVTPGLTCTWQVRGGLDVSFDEWMRMDIEYAENRGFWKDVKLILQTMWRMLLMRASH